LRWQCGKQFRIVASTAEAPNLNMDKIKDFFSKLSTHDLPMGGAVLIGILLLLIVYKAEKIFIRLAIFLIAAALLAGAYWWHQHR
jgi:hypothetical protein